MWQPPSTSPAICSLYDVTSSVYVTLRNEGSSTFGETDAVLLVGPTAPATNLRHSFVETLSEALLASKDAYLLISKTHDSSP